EAVIGQGSAVTLVGGSKVVFRTGARVEAGSRLQVKVQRILPTGEGLRIKHKFTGQEQDSSGLYYYGARYYDPELGRFIQPDTFLDGLNRYAYCGNNPINFIDPTGHDVSNPGFSGYDAEGN